MHINVCKFSAFFSVIFTHGPWHHKKQREPWLSYCIINLQKITIHTMEFIQDSHVQCLRRTSGNRWEGRPLILYNYKSPGYGPLVWSPWTKLMYSPTPLWKNIWQISTNTPGSLWVLWWWSPGRSPCTKCISGSFPDILLSQGWRILFFMLGYLSCRVCYIEVSLYRCCTCGIHCPKCSFYGKF